MVRSTITLGLLLLSGCHGPAEDQQGAMGPIPTTVRAPRDTEPSAEIVHSTPADTAGSAADLRIIERKLGPLDAEVLRELEVVPVRYFTFTDSTYGQVDTRRTCTGVLVVHSCIAQEVSALFHSMLLDTFPIAKVVPINRYGLNADSTGWNDQASMADNNTSAFNYRAKATSGSRSKHAQGIAIDINPRQNPMVRHNAHGTITEPTNSRYDATAPGTLNRANTAKYLTVIGWSWGGRWPRPQDHQHIEKSRGSCTHLRYSLR